MSDFFTDAAKWEHFLDDIEPWQLDATNAIDALRREKAGERVALSDVIGFLKSHGLEVKNRKWLQDYMGYLCVLGFADPVLGGWDFAYEKKITG